MRLFSFLLVAVTLVSVHHVEAVGTELRRVFQARIRVDQQRLEAALAEREKAKAVTVVLNTERPHLVNAATHANAHGDDTVSAAQQTWSNKVMELMGEYWADALAAHHVAPTFEYAWLIAGSLARGEACAYSDAEAILVVKSADLAAARKLFRQDQFGGKTFLEQYQGIPIEAVKYGMAQLGVMFDAAISPRNAGNLPDMFDTAAAFANHAQTNTQNQVRRTLINLIAHPTMRSSAPFAAASLKTIQDGVKTTAKALALLTVAEITRPTEDWFDAGFHLVPNQEFDVKKAFTRPFHFALEILSLYYGVAPDRVNYADRADHLPTAKVHANLARRIKRALQAAYRLRIIAHDLAARESDKISIVAPLVPSATTHVLTPAEKTAVDAMVELKKCLKTKFTAWYNKKQNKVLKNSPAFKTDCTCTNAPDSIC